ncbi:MAG: MBL fold metallo-hydrolase [Bacteroidota bacterium]
MKLITLGSSSSGNGYLLHNGGEALVLEAGVNLMLIKIHLDFNVRMVKGCLVSHAHKDHAKHIRSYAKEGINILGPGEVFTSINNRYYPVEPGKGYKLGNFSLIPYEVAHDVTCYCYLIDHPQCGKILFLTDSYLCEYIFPGLNHILIEANYADDILEENVLKGIEHPAKRERLLTSHMELKSLKAFLKAQDLSSVHNIVLLHLSDQNSHAIRFQQEITSLTGKQIHVAYPGMIADLSLSPF